MAGTPRKHLCPRAPRLGATAVLALLVLLLASCTPPGSPAPREVELSPNTPTDGKLIDIGRDLTKYVKLGGDQVVVVPNGVYTAGSVAAPHLPTSGKYKGWLVLKAQTPYGAVVDLSRSMFTLQPGTSRVLFVGFKFVKGSVDIQGNDIAFWYTDHTFPANEWVRQAPDPSRPESGLYRAPRTIYADEGSTQNVSFYGVDAHDTSSGILISRSKSTKLEGVHLWNLSDMGLDPQDVTHSDAIAGVVGQSKNLLVRDTWVQGRIMLIDANGSLTAGGPHEGFVFANTWVSNSPSASFTFTSRKPSAPYGIFGKRINVRSWAANNGKDRIDIVDGRQYYAANTQPSKVNVQDVGIVTAAPPSGSPSPAALWRKAHPYEDWMYAIR
jgi:hypothetical protein